MLSVVLSFKNETSNSYFPKIIDSLSKIPSIDVVCVDGGSTDGTAEKLDRTNFRVFSLPGNSRAARLNLGIKNCLNPWILLHHPRCLLSEESVRNLVQRLPNYKPCWGGFTHRFDDHHPLLGFTSWYSTQIRLRFRKIAYLDHCPFFHKSLLDQHDSAPVPLLDIFEDTAWSQKMAKHSRPKILKEISQVSAVRFNKNGYYRQAALNQILKVGYGLGWSSETMNKVYEKGLSLNAKY